MFLKHLPEDQLTSIFSDYKTLNSEQYLRAIIKTDLTNEQINTIEILRKKSLLPDHVINLLVDYTLYKTNGVVNEKYIRKTASTINALGLESLNQIYDHFHFIKSVEHQASNEQIHPEALVEWSCRE
jgi:replication initiation and membrane attachment protein